MTFPNKQLLGALCLAGLLSSCASSPEKPAEQPAPPAVDSTAIKAAEKAHAEREERGFHTFDVDFQTLVVTYEGVVRGMKMGMSPAEVKAQEAKDLQAQAYDGTKTPMPRAKLAQESAEALRYTLAMAEAEDAVITYDFSGGQLSRIHLRVHLPSNTTFEAIEDELIQFFTHKHGQPALIDGRKEVWKVNGGDVHEIDILDKQEGEQFYLEVEVK
jgi:hypothetical protein